MRKLALILIFKHFFFLISNTKCNSKVIQLGNFLCTVYLHAAKRFTRRHVRGKRDFWGCAPSRVIIQDVGSNKRELSYTTTIGIGMWRYPARRKNTQYNHNINTNPGDWEEKQIRCRKKIKAPKFRNCNQKELMRYSHH